MSYSNNYKIYKKSNDIHNKYNNINKSNNYNIYSEPSSNEITSITSNLYSPSKIISLKSNNMSSITSLRASKINNESNSIIIDSENKMNKRNPSIILPKNIFNSIDDGYKTNIFKNNNYNISKKRINSIYNLYNNINLKKNSKEENSNKLLKKYDSINYKINFLDKNDDKLYEELKSDKNQIKNKFNEKFFTPKKIEKKIKFNLYNTDKKYYNIYNQNTIKLFKGKNTKSQYKNKFPNISVTVDDNNNTNKKKDNIIIKNLKTDINNNPKKNIMDKKTRISWILNNKKININSIKNYEFIQGIKSRQLMSIYKRYKVCQKRNKLEEIAYYKDKVFPIETIKLLVSKRNELTIDKFRNEYINKLKNFCLFKKEMN